MGYESKHARKYSIDGTEIDILDARWEVLIILDACRYDFFKELYLPYLGEAGILKNGISPATFTIEWLNKVFGSRKLNDTIYISGTVWNNFRGITPEHKGYRFDGRQHFRRVVDVWDWGWDNAIGTVHPREINKAAIVSSDMYKKKKLIIHYMQPHSPYISYGGIQREKGDIRVTMKEKNLISYWLKNPWASPFFSPFRKILNTDEKRWRVGGIFKVLPEGTPGDIWLKYGKDGLIKGYKENLKLALQYVEDLSKNVFCEKKIIITSDHGERLLEKGNFGHGGKRDKEVIEVPWLEINMD